MKIEKNIPVPPVQKIGRSGKKHGGNNRLYPFGEMEIGDSIFVDLSNWKKARDAAFQYGKRNNLKFTTRKTDCGVRIWRIS